MVNRINLSKSNDLLCRPNQQYKPAFTLAEVLITLGIIGVIAALTLPTLLAKTQHKELKEKFTKSYAEISQALISTKSELGTEGFKNHYKHDRPDDEVVDEGEFINTFLKQFKTVGTKAYTIKPINYTNTGLADWSSRELGTSEPTTMLADGSSIDCMIGAFNIYISVDTNGPLNKPNRAGYDIFAFTVSKNDTVEPPDFNDWYDMNRFLYQCGGPNKGPFGAINGVGCSYYAMIDKNPQDETKGYWESLQ